MHSYLQRVQNAIDEAVRGMDSRQLAWHPPGKWSTAAILEHLSLTYGGTAKGLQRCLQAGHPSISPTGWRERVAGFVVTRLSFMPSGRQAPSMVNPKGAAPEIVLKEVRGNLAAADDALSRCEAQFGTRRKISNHPFLGPLSVPQWRKFHWLHACHHMKQVARLRAQMKVSR